MNLWRMWMVWMFVVCASVLSPIPVLGAGFTNGKIAFVSVDDIDGDTEIFTINPDGSGLVQMTNNSVDDESPSWSPDGTKIAFVSEHPDSGHAVYVMSADGSGKRQLFRGRPRVLSWSPDGLRIAYDLYQADDWRDNSIGTINIDGSGNQPLDFGWQPAWSPDGRRILITKSTSDGWRLHSIRPDGTGLQALPNELNVGEFGDFGASWSPGGDRIAYIRSVWDGDNQLYLANADGTDRAHFHGCSLEGPSCTSAALTPAFSPDGQKIVFDYFNWADTPQGRHNLYIKNIDGTGLTLLARDGFSPSWQAASTERPPAGSQLAFVRDGQIYLVNADGTGLTQLTNTESLVTNMDPAWSRDGQRLAFARWTCTDESCEYGPRVIYMMNADGSNVIQLTSGRESHMGPVWGPDDREILFSAYWGLRVMDVDADGSQGSRQLYYYAYGIGMGTPAWSPDGQTITFSVAIENPDLMKDLYAMNADGSNVRRLLQGPSVPVDGLFEYYQSDWSPDGQSIAVVRCPWQGNACVTNGSVVAVANADGSGLREIAQTRGRASGKPTWSPDGRWIAYGSANSIRYVQVDGGTEDLIVDNGHSPAWRPEVGAAIDVAHSGAWYYPTTSGQGQFLDIEPDQQFVFLSWFTYTEDDSDHPNEQHWFTAQGNYNAGKAELTLYESIGGQFDAPQAVTTTPVGHVTLTFSGCDQGTMSYRFDDRDLEGSFPMVRAIPGSGNLCENLTGSTTQAVNVNHGMDGAWYDPNTSGQGFFFDVHAGEGGKEFIFASWFTYGDDTASGQRWLTAEGEVEGSRAELQVYDTQGGSFDDPQAVQTVEVGTMSIDFSDCNHAVLNYALPAENSEGQFDLQRAVPGGEGLCEVLNASQ